MDEFEILTGAEIAHRRSSGVRNPYALASRWRREGKIFAIEYDKQLRYPIFQLDKRTFDPLPVVTKVLVTLPRDQMTDWEVAFWWIADNDWLNRRRPVDLRLRDPEAVIDAAAHLAEPSPL